MILKLKALGLTSAAILAISAVVVAPTVAETGGHFTTEVDHTELKGEDVAGSEPVFTAFGQTVRCSEVSHTGTISSASTTATELTITPTHHKCEVTSLETPATFAMNGCDYVLTIRAVNPQSAHNTTHLTCPGSKGPTITSEGVSGHCTLEITPNITPTTGVVWETGAPPGPIHDIIISYTDFGLHTLRVSGGFFACGTFSSTDANSTMTGKVTVRGFNTAGEQVGITATGSS